MKTLAWVVWSLGCLLLVKNLVGLRKPRGRILRLFFCLITVTALALTLLTPLSKFHLLWILPLRLLLGFLGFGLLAGAGFARYKMTARKPKETTLATGRFPPFDSLNWSNDEWEGEMRLPAWAGFQSRGGPYGAQDSESPSDGKVKLLVNPSQRAEQMDPTPEQCRALQFQLDHGEEVVQAVLTALLPHYRQLKKDCEADDEQMPVVSDSTEFRRMIGLNQIHILPHVREGIAYIGLECGCDWDEEHGLGIVLHRKQVIEIGQASDAFDWQPETAQP